MFVILGAKFVLLKLNIKKFIIILVFITLLGISYGFASENFGEGNSKQFKINNTEENKKNETIDSKKELQICNDGDGEDFFTKGNITLLRENNSRIFEDTCSDNSTLIEYICDGNLKKEIKFECEFGCFEGKCLTCEELDNCEILEDNETNTTEENTTITCEDENCSLEIFKSPPSSIFGKTNYLYDKNGLIGKDMNGVNSYFVHDYLGSLRLVLDSNGLLDNQYEYFPFGKSTNGDFGKYTGKEYDEQIDLYYYGARYYDPNTGRFTQVDPVDSIKSPYKAFRNNPGRYIDPDGRDVIDVTSEEFKKLYPDFMNNIQSEFWRVYMPLHIDSNIKVYLNADFNYVDQSVMDTFKKNPKWGAFTRFFYGNNKIAHIYLNPGTILGNQFTPLLVEGIFDHELIHSYFVFIEGRDKLLGEKEGSIKSLRNEIDTYELTIKHHEERLKNEKDNNRKKAISEVIDFFKKNKKDTEKEYDNKVTDLMNVINSF